MTNINKAFIYFLNENKTITNSLPYPLLYYLFKYSTRGSVIIPKVEHASYSKAQSDLANLDQKV